jgi:hypothetical protein
MLDRLQLKQLLAWRLATGRDSRNRSILAKITPKAKKKLQPDSTYLFLDARKAGGCPFSQQEEEANGMSASGGNAACSGRRLRVRVEFELGNMI